MDFALPTTASQASAFMNNSSLTFPVLPNANNEATNETADSGDAEVSKNEGVSGIVPTLQNIVATVNLE